MDVEILKLTAVATSIGDIRDRGLELTKVPSSEHHSLPLHILDSSENVEDRSSTIVIPQ
jgi:hypothetical protein